jgi:hypothetical protein
MGVYVSVIPLVKFHFQLTSQNEISFSNRSISMIKRCQNKWVHLTKEQHITLDSS